ncbi:MAG: PAS domain S-box protein [Ignavibacteria bacterium]
MPVSNSDYSRSGSVFDSIRIFLKKITIRQPERKQIWTALALLAGGLLLTLTASLLLKTKVETDAKTEFGFVSALLNQKIMAMLYTHAQLVRSGAAFFENSETVTRNEWQNFVAKQRIEKNSYGIYKTGYAEIILPDQLALHEKKIKSEGFRQYSVKPVGKREIYTPVIYIEPFLSGDEFSLGCDMFSEPVCRKTMETARDLNTAYLSKKIRVVRKINKDIQTDAFMCAPVYKKGMPSGNVKECRRAIRGWVFITYQMNDLITKIFEDYGSLSKQHIRLEIFDDFSFNQNALLYDNREVTGNNVNPAPLFSLKYSVSFNGTLWYSRYTQYAPIESGLDYSIVWYVTTGGISISILLFIVYLLLINTNIRAHELAEELTRDLSKRETEYSSMIANISDVICILDTNGIVKYNSPNAEKWFGWQPQDIIGTVGWSRVHPDDLERIQKDFLSLFEKDNLVKTTEYRYKCKDGSYKFIHLTATNLINDPVINGVLVNYHDITERRQAEETIAASALRDKILFQTAVNGIYIIDNQGNITDVNPAACGMLGYSREELLRLNISDLDTRLVPELMLPKIKELINNLNSQSSDVPSYKMSTKHRRKDGSVIDVEINNTIITLNGRQYLYSSTQDVTRQKRNAEVLQLRESYLSAIIENQQGMIWLKDMDSKILVVNKKFSDEFGFDNPEELVGKTDSDLWPQELADKYIADDLRAVQTKNTIMTQEQISDKEGNVKWVETYKTPIIDNQGIVIGTTGYSIDITGRKQAK